MVNINNNYNLTTSQTNGLYILVQMKKKKYIKTRWIVFQYKFYYKFNAYLLVIFWITDYAERRMDGE